MSLSLARIADMVQGQLSGSGEIEISAATILRDAGPDHITLVENAQLADQLTRSAAGAVVVPLDYQPPGIPSIAVESPRTAFAQIVAHFRPAHVAKQIGISPAAVVSPTAQLADDVDVFPGAHIGDDVHIGRGSTIHSGVCIMPGGRIGENVTIFPNAVLYEYTRVADRAIIHAGAILGAYGFGYEIEDGCHKLSVQLGHVEIGEDAEIGACTTIDRGTYGATSIGAGTKIDNQVMIGHNCRIGRHNLLVAQVGIAGSCTTGDYVVMAGQVGVRDHTKIGDRAQIAAKAGVSTDLDGDQKYWGSPAIPARRQMQIVLANQKLPELRRQVRQLEKQISDLTSQSASTKSQPTQSDAA